MESLSQTSFNTYKFSLCCCVLLALFSKAFQGHLKQLRRGGLNVLQEFFCAAKFKRMHKGKMHRCIRCKGKMHRITISLGPCGNYVKQNGRHKNSRLII